MKIPTALFILIVIVLLAIIGYCAKAEVGDTVEQELKRSPGFVAVQDERVGAYRAIVRSKIETDDLMMCIFGSDGIEIVNSMAFAQPPTDSQVNTQMATYGVHWIDVGKNNYGWRCYNAEGRDLQVSISPDRRMVQFFTDEGSRALVKVAATLKK